MARTVGFFRRHQQALLRAGGLTMVAVGLLLVTGGWDLLTAGLRQWASQFTSII